MNAFGGKDPLQRTRENCDKARNEQQKSMLLNEGSKVHLQEFLRLKRIAAAVRADVQSIREKLRNRISGSLNKAC